MLTRFACLALALILPIGVPVALAAGPAPAALPARPSTQALELARLMAPRQVMVDGELRQFDLNFSRTLLQKKEVAAAEAQYPGLIEAMAKASRPLLGQQTGERLDRLYPQIAVSIQAQLTLPEIAELTAFFGSPEGQSVLKKMSESVDAGPVYESAAKDGKVTEDAVEAQQWIAAVTAAGKYSEADRLALEKLGKRPVFAKLKVVQLKLRSILIGAMNSPDPAYEKQIDEAMSAAVASHIETLSAQASKPSK